MKLTKIKNEALHLSVDERAELACLLLESLDEISDKEHELLWVEEVVRRARQIDQGIVKLVTAEELEIRIQNLLK